MRPQVLMKYPVPSLLFLCSFLVFGCSDSEGSSGGASGGVSDGAGSGGLNGAAGGAATGGTASGGTASGGSGNVSAPKLDGALALTSSELMAELDIGWNLGNALDAPGQETAWSNPTITPQLLEAVRDAGFDLVRIPVTWAPHLGSGPNYTIEPLRMARVAEVVGYARDAGLAAIINVHHDGADGWDEVEWLELSDALGDATNQAVVEQFEAVWGQIASHFADHDGTLLFESMNEIHDGYPQEVDQVPPAHFDIIEDLNQRFVNVVRASGGNNSTRHLIVPGYNTNIKLTLGGFTLPTDTVANRLSVAVHFYDPYTFALEATEQVWPAGSWATEDYMLDLFDQLKTAYVDRGVPVVIGEYGATNQSGFEDSRRYYMEFVTKAAHSRGLVPVYWDNGGLNSGAENLGLFDRNTNAIAFPEIVSAMMRGADPTHKMEDISEPTP